MIKVCRLLLLLLSRLHQNTKVALHLPHCHRYMQLAAALCQGGEFAFILFALARDQRLMDANVADTLMLVVSLSMALTPFIYSAATRFAEKAKDERAARPYDEVTNTDHMVVIAGLGRFGQIAGRILRGLEIPFTALDIDPDDSQTKRAYGEFVRETVSEARDANECLRAAIYNAPRYVEGIAILNSRTH